MANFGVMETRRTAYRTLNRTSTSALFAFKRRNSPAEMFTFRAWPHECKDQVAWRLSHLGAIFGQRLYQALILNAEHVEDRCCAHGRQQSHNHHHGKERRGE